MEFYIKRERERKVEHVLKSFLFLIVLYLRYFKITNAYVNTWRNDQNEY